MVRIRNMNTKLMWNQVSFLGESKVRQLISILYKSDGWARERSEIMKDTGWSTSTFHNLINKILTNDVKLIKYEGAVAHLINFKIPPLSPESIYAIETGGKPRIKIPERE